MGRKEKPRTLACGSAGQRGVSWRDCCSGNRRLSAAGRIYDSCRCGQGQVALAWKETASAPGECVWTCDLISNQACPCQPECRRRRASHAPEQAALRPGAGEPRGFQLPLAGVFVFLLPALSAVVQQMSQTCCLYVHGSGLRGERAGARPCLRGAAHASQAGDGWGCSSSSLLSFTKPAKGWALHSWLCQSCSLSNWQRWMCKERRFSITVGMLAHNEEKRAVDAAALSVWR